MRRLRGSGFTPGKLTNRRGMTMRHGRIARLTLVAIAALVSAEAFGGGPASVDEAISLIEQRIRPAMKRTAVEDELKKIPNLSVTYQPVERMLSGEERSVAGKKVSGRISATTNLEIDGLSKALGHALIFFDEQDRVIDVRVDGFGFEHPGSLAP